MNASKSKKKLGRFSAVLDPFQKWRRAVYRELDSDPVDYDAKLTTETARQSDVLFDSKIVNAPSFKQNKVVQKRADFARLFLSLKRASYKNGCVVIQRNRNHPDFTKTRMQLVRAIVEAGLAKECRSPAGSPSSSRLVPCGDMVEAGMVDPWTFEPNPATQFVYVRDRATKKEIPFDFSHPIAVETQNVLELVNRVNAKHEFTHLAYNYYAGKLDARRQIRPVHFAQFSDNFDLHGRIYTGRYGHHGLRQIERQTMRCGGVPMIEYDFAGLHPRMAYHLSGIDYENDPYALWGSKTTPKHRLLAKTLLNTLLNADSTASAIDACNYRMCSKNKEGRYKRWKALEEARRLWDAKNETGIWFSAMVESMLAMHCRIRRFFSSDAGVRLMRMDSKIALAVHRHFAEKDVPCLSVHDSFLVPKPFGRELKSVMAKAYRELIGFNPVIKRQKHAAEG